MIHHVGLEVEARDLDACVAFWNVLGWREVGSLLPGARRRPGADRAGAEHEGDARADAIADPGRWLQRGVHQIHLQPRERGAAVVPQLGHPALVDPDLDATVERLAEAGFEVLERTRHWDARRVFTRCPAGHRVELMSAPPQ